MSQNKDMRNINKNNRTSSTSDNPRVYAPGSHVAGGPRPLVPDKNLTKFDIKVRKAMTRLSETKTFDKVVTSVGVDYAGAIVSLSDVTVGNTDTTRTGDMITPVSLDIRAQFVTGDTTNIVRVLIVRWKPYDGAYAPAVSDVLQYLSSTNSPLSPLNRDILRGGQADIVFDRLIDLSLYEPTEILITSIKLDPKFPLTYIAGTTGGQNKLYIVYISDSAAVAHPSISYTTRLNFFEEF